MDIHDFERVNEAFEQFHAFFAPAFGRKQWRQRSRHYLQALLVQSQQRRNAENLAEMVDASPRVLQRFLTEATWDDQAVTKRLQEYLAPRLLDIEGVWVVDESGFPKQGVHSVGVARQYCGALGKVASCQMGVFLAYVSPRGRALVDKTLYLPQSWVQDPARCEQAGIPEEDPVYQTKPEFAWKWLQRAQAWGHLHAAWVAGDDLYGPSPLLRDRLRAAGYGYVLDVQSNPLCWTPTAPGDGQRHTLKERAEALPPTAWQSLTVAEGAQGERTYLFACEPVYDNRDQQPGTAQIAVYRKNRDASEPRYYYAHAPAPVSLLKLGQVAATRWSVETEFETNKQDIGLDEYEVRSYGGWNHHITLGLLASAFLLSLQQEGGEKDASDHPPTGISDRAGIIAQTAPYACRPFRLAGEDATAQRMCQAFTPQTTKSPLVGAVTG